MSAATSRQRRSGSGSGGRSSGDPIKRRDRLEALAGLADSARKLRLTDDDDDDVGALEMTGGGGTGSGRPSKPSSRGGRRSRDRLGSAQRRFSAMSQTSTRSEISTNSAASDMAVAPKFDEQIRRSRGARIAASDRGGGGGGQHPRSNLDRRSRASGKGRGGAAAVPGRGRSSPAAPEGPSPSPGRGIFLDDNASFSSAHSVSSMATAKAGNRAPPPRPPSPPGQYIDSSHSAKTIQMDNKRSRPRRRFETSDKGGQGGSGNGGGGSARSMTSTDSGASEGSEEKKKEKGERRRSGRDKKDGKQSSSEASKAAAAQNVRRPSTQSEDGNDTDEALEGEGKERPPPGSSDGDDAKAKEGGPRIADEEGLDDEALENRDQFGASDSDNLPPGADAALDLDQLCPEDRTAFLCRGLADSVQALVTALYSLEDGNRGFPSSVSAAILDHTDSIDLAINRIKPVVASIDAGELESDADSSESIGTYLGRIGRLVDMLTETLTNAGRSRVWTAGSEACYVTILELLQRSCLELRHFYDAECGGAEAAANDGDDSESGSNLPPLSPDAWELGHKVPRAWAAAGQEDRLQSMGVDPDKITAALAAAASSSSPAVDEHGFPIDGDSSGSNLSLGVGPPIEVRPDAFRAAALEVLLSNLEWTPHSIDDVREACSLVREDGEGVDEGGNGAAAESSDAAVSADGAGAANVKKKKKRASSTKSEGSAAATLLAMAEEGEEAASSTTSATAPLSEREDDSQQQAQQQRDREHREKAKEEKSKKKKDRRRSEQEKHKAQAQEEEAKMKVKAPKPQPLPPPTPAAAAEVAAGPIADVPHAARHVLGRIRGAPLPRSAIVDGAAKKLLADDSPGGGGGGAGGLLHAGGKSMSSLGSTPGGGGVGGGEGSAVIVASEIFGGYDAAGAGESPSASSAVSLHRPDCGLGMEGVGKTTVAALVVSRDDVRRRFAGGVVWLDVGRRFGHGGDCDSCRRDDCCDAAAAASASTRGNSSRAAAEKSHGGTGEGPMSYAEYRSYLESMCRQLGVSPASMPRFDDAEEPQAGGGYSASASSPTSPPIRTPVEPSQGERRKAEHRAMKTARRRAAAVFRDRREGRVLLVLDDVAAEEDLRWFSFAPSSSSSHGGGDGGGDDSSSFSPPRLLVTTRNRRIGKSLGSAAAAAGGRVDVGPLEPDEAAALLLSESDVSGQQDGKKKSDKTSAAAAAIAGRCGRHPLAVRAAGQWCRLKKAAVGMDTAVQEVGEEVDKCWERASMAAAAAATMASERGSQRKGPGRGAGGRHDSTAGGSNNGGGGGENVIVYEILGRVLSPLMGGKETSVIKLCFAALARVFTSWVPCIPLDLAMTLWEGVLLAEGTGGDGGGEGGESTEGGAEGDKSAATASSLQEAESFARMSAKQRRNQIRLIAEAMSSLGAVQLSAKRSGVGEGGDGEMNQSNDDGSDAADATEKFLEMHHGIVQEYGEYLCTDRGGLAPALVRDCERRWNRAFVSSFLSLKGPSRGWDDLGSILSPDCQDYALNMIVSHMIRAEMYGEARDLLTDDKFARGRLSLLGCEAGTRRHVRDSEELCRRMRAKAAVAAASGGSSSAAGAAAAASLESRKTLAQSYAKFSAIIGAEVQRNQGSNDAESSLTACRALDRIGLSFVRNKCWREAIGLYEATVKFLKSAGHDDSELVAVMLFNVGTAYSELDEYESSFKAYGNCVKVREKTLGENNAIFLKTLHRMGDALADSWKLEPAMQCYDKAVLKVRLNPSMERKMLGNVLMSKGRVKFKRGELGEAAKCGEEALRGKRSELGSGHEALSREYAFLSDVCAARGDAKEAKRNLDEAIRLKRPRGAAESEGGDMLLFRGSRHRLNGEYDDCLAYYSKALDSLKAGQGCRKGEIADMLHMVALAYALRGDDVAAIKGFEESLRSRRTRSRKADLDIARTLFEMGLCHKRLEKYDKALKCIDECLSIRKNQLGDCEMVMLTLKEIGTIHMALTEYVKAGTFYDDAFQMCVTILGTDHEHCATIFHEQGVLKSQTNSKDEAMKCFDKSLEIRRQRLGADHPSVGESLHMMGCLLIGQNSKHETAEYCLQESLRIRKACFGNDDQRVADTLHMLGTLQEQIGKSDNAIQLLSDALRIRRLAKNQGNIAKSLNDLGTVYRLKQQYDLAIECFEESLGLFLQDMDNNKESILSANIALGDSEAALGRSRAACTHYEQALDIMMQMPSNTPERIPRLLQKIGFIEYKVGETDKAKNHLLGYIFLWKESGMDDDIDYVNALHIVGTIHRANGEEEKAHDCWAEAYQTYHDKGLAAKNPHLGGELKKLLQEIARDSGAFKNSIFSKFRDGLSDEAA